jgi:hypothetical protein
MQGDQRVRLRRLNPETPQDGRLFPARPTGFQSIDHDIAHQVNALGWNALMQQIVYPTAFADEQLVCDRVGQNAIDFFRHRTIEAAKPRFHMIHGYAKFDSHESRSDGAVDVAHHHEAVRMFGSEHRFQTLHDFSGLDRVRSRSHL